MKIHLPATTSASDTPVSNLRIRATTLGHPLDGDDAAISKGHDLPISEIDHTAVVESVGLFRSLRPDFIAAEWRFSACGGLDEQIVPVSKTGLHCSRDISSMN